MIRLNKKYVFHIPLFRYADDRLEPIDMDDIFNELLAELTDNGFENFYISKVRGYYKSRSFDELLITIFVSDNGEILEEVFKSWFQKNNHILSQEAFSFESGNEMYIIQLNQ